LEEIKMDRDTQVEKYPKKMSLEKAREIKIRLDGLRQKYLEEMRGRNIKVVCPKEELECID
jgi:hypothetical protein